MMNHEFQRHLESVPQKLDAIVVLGKNIGVDWTKKEIAEQRFNLSPHSRINVLAAGLLYRAGFTDKIIFSTGKTSGKDVPSEAQAMKNHLLRIFKHIPEEDIILEEESWDTNTNAKAVKEKLKEHGFKNVGLLTTGFHLDRSSYLFNKAGIDARDFYSEDELKRKFPRFTEKYIESALYKQEELKEKKALGIQQKLPPELLSLVAWITRNRSLSGLSLLKP